MLRWQLDNKMTLLESLDPGTPKTNIPSDLKIL